MVVTRISIATAWTALWLVVSCDTGPSHEDLAQERFEEFQTALLQRDQAALKYLVCSDARPAAGTTKLAIKNHLICKTENTIGH